MTAMPIEDAPPPPDFNPFPRADRWLLRGLVIATVATRLLAAAIWWSDTATDPDAYVGIAKAIAAGDGFCTPGTKTPTAYRPPLYPLLLSGYAALPAPLSNDGIVALNTLFSILLVLALFLRLRQNGFSLLGSTIAAGAILLDPLLIRATPLAMTEPVFTFLVTAALLTLLTNERLSVGAGLFLGLAALCRPTVWPFIGLYSLGLLIVHRRYGKDAIRPLGMMWLVIAAVVSPWVIRNQAVMGHPILTTTHGGYTLLLGNNPVLYNEVARQPWGTVWEGASLDRWQRAMLAEMDADLGPNADEVAMDRWQAAKAWRHIRDDPAGFGWAVWYRVRSLWSLSPRGQAGESLPGVVRWLVAAWYAALFGFAIAGAVIWWRERRPGLWVLLLFIASVQMMHLVYWTDMRMRAPLHPVLALLAAVAVERLWRRR
jgi:hypothetical protein